MANPQSNERKAFLFAFIAIILWSTVASAFKITLKYYDSTTLLTFSSFFSLIVLLIVLVSSGKFNLLFIQAKKEWLSSLLLGFLNPFLYYLILFNAYDLLPAQEAMVLNYSWPLVLSIFSVFFLKRNIKPFGYMALLISFVGIITIATKGNIFSMKLETPVGVALALGSAVVWAGFWILNMKDKREPILKLTSAFIFGTIFSFIFLIFFLDFPKLTLGGIIGTAYIGTFEMGLTFIFWLTALSLTQKTAKVSQLVYLSPFLSLIIISIILHEKILFSSIIGLVLIILGIFLQNTKGSKS